MNWTKFQTYGMAPDKAFEMLCNQLFENWCKNEYGSSIATVHAVNGAGGDGGVESYAVLRDGSIIGLQAKWFPTSISDSQISQIKNSIKTAIKVRPQIVRYIVCVPRDLASQTARSINAEDTRWNALISSVSKDSPSLTVELWNETRLITELQKPISAGIFKFWFENAEIDDESIMHAFQKAKDSWLNTKYMPELNCYGSIEHMISLLLGDIEQRKKQAEIFKTIHKLCHDYHSAAEAFMAVCKDQPELIDILTETYQRLTLLADASWKISSWYAEEVSIEEDIDSGVFNIDFDSIANSIRQNRDSSLHHFHASDVTSVLNKLGQFDLYSLIKDFEWSYHKDSILVLGDPGTGKTHGIGACSEKLLSEGTHIPLLVQARNVPLSHTWQNIISDCLRLSQSWNEDEIWQALTSLSNRHSCQEKLLLAETKVSSKVIIFVDGLDESSTHERWIERIQETKTITACYPQIRFCFSARPTAFNKSIGYAKVKRLNSLGDAPVHVLFDSYMEAYNIKMQNNGWLKHSLTSPLALKLFCELNQNQIVNLSDRAEISMTELWRKKIEKIEREYCDRIGSSARNQYVFRAVVLLSRLFMASSRLERLELAETLATELNIAKEPAECLLDYLESYGILSCLFEHGTGLHPDRYFLYPGIQGYFDFAAAMQIAEQFNHPKDIDFTEYKKLTSNTLNSLAIISIQKHGYLLTRNQTIGSVLDEWSIQELQFWSLLHSAHDVAVQFKERILEIMAESADGLITITNRLALPLARDCEHPLGVKLIDEFLGSFDKPAQRDILWSIPGYLHNSINKRWYQSETFELQDDCYALDSDDTYKGCPTVYAWALSSVNNSLRMLYRNRLMEWALAAPEEFYKLFLKFAFVNDPQIRSDLFSILMCLVYDGADQLLIKTASDWILENILHPDRIDENRNIAIRYYSIGIVKKAIQLNLLNEEALREYMPPYRPMNNSIALNHNALSGTRMSGYSAIDYDLSRYVLIDHISSDFNSYSQRNTKQFEKLIETIIAEQPEYAGMTVETFILSASYAYLLQMGWNEDDFYNFALEEESDRIIGGVDCSIRGSYSPATHGSQSNVMTVCEKYIWQARNVLTGFLCDRLPGGDANLPITDYTMLSDFIIPIQETRIIDPDNIPDERPWNIPEREKVILEGSPSNADDVIANTLNAPTLEWEKWLFFRNNDGAYAVDDEELVALDMYSSFNGSAGVETCLFLNAIMMNSEDVLKFVDAVAKTPKDSDNSIYNPVDWNGGIQTSCYITPKEVCWFSWKPRYDSFNVEKFPQNDLNSTIDECCYNSQKYGDVCFYLPSAPIRKILDIVDSDGYRFYDENKRIIAEYNITGERWRTYQQYVVLSKAVWNERLKDAGKSLVWIMRERRLQNGNAKERFGEFGADRIKSYIGYFQEDKFVVKEIYSETFETKK